MLLDPFTIIAQIINFVILVVALKYLLYNRIIDAMDAREAAIAARIDRAEEREQQADEARQDHRDKLEELERRRGELLDGARADAAERRCELLESARLEIEAQRRRWQQALQRDQRDLEQDLRTRTAEVAVSISRRVLSDLADADLQRRSVELALEHLVGDEAFADFIDAGAGTPVTVRTAFDDESIQDLVRARLAEHGVGDDELLSFETDPTLLIGIEFVSPTESIEWHGADYLEQLGRVVGELLDDDRTSDRVIDDELPRAEGQMHADAS
jgi:F-type H+-transporting ATPase subunit b